MGTRPTLHSDQEFLSQDIGHSLNGARVTAILTDTQVAAADTNAGLAAAARAFTGHADTAPLAGCVARAIEYGKADASLSDANILSETTIPGLVADTYADPLKPWPTIL